MTIQTFISNLITELNKVYTYAQMGDALGLDRSTVYTWHKQLPRLDKLAEFVRLYPEGDWRGEFARAILRYALFGEQNDDTPIRVEFEQSGDPLPVA